MSATTKNIISDHDGLRGKWNGSIIIKQKPGPAIALEIDKDINGFLKVLLHSPGQKSFNIKADSVKLTGDSLFVLIKGLNVALNLTSDGDTLKGLFAQGPGVSVPVEFRKVDEFPFKVLQRPQEPKEPYSYISENIEFKSFDNVKIRGTITRPREEGKLPAVVLISGSGASDRDQTIFGHKTFLVLSHLLTKNGYAVLRFDDRGAGESEGDFSKTTIMDHAQDASAAVSYLLSRAEIDPKRIGLIGHSLGGDIAPAASLINPDISFMVLMAASTLPLKDVIIEQCDSIYSKMGVSKGAVELNREILETLFTTINQQHDLGKIKEIAQDAINRYNPRLAEISEADMRVLGIKAPINIAAYSKLLIPFMKYDLFYNPAETLERVNIPVFAINGDMDVQVASHNLDKISSILAKRGNRHNRVTLYKGVNHLMQNCKTGRVDEYGQIEETFSEEIAHDISEWIESLWRKDRETNP